MLSLIGAFFAWAVNNKFAVGLFTFIGSKIFVLIEDYIKRKYFPQKEEVIIVKGKNGSKIKQRLPNKKKILNGYILLFSMFCLLGLYIFYTYQQMPYLSKERIIEEFEQIKLLIIMFVIFLMVKILNFNTTLQDMISMLPLVRKFIKK